MLTNKLSPELIQELFEGRKNELTSYLYRSEGIIRSREVDRDNFISEVYSQGTAGAVDPIRATLVAAGEDAPLSHSAVIARPGRLDRRALQESLDKVDGKSFQAQVRSLDVLIGDKLMHTIARGHEQELAQILLGNGASAISREISTEALAAGQEFNTSTSLAREALDELLLDVGGRGHLVLGFNVAQALCRHPNYRGDGRQLTFPELVAFLQGQGFEQIYIDGQVFHNGALKQNFSPARSFNGVAAVIGPDALERCYAMDMSLNTWEDNSKRATMISVFEYSGFVVRDPSMVKCYTNTMA